jgi:hypothetical protein
VVQQRLAARESAGPAVPSQGNVRPGKSGHLSGAGCAAICELPKTDPAPAPGPGAISLESHHHQVGQEHPASQRCRLTISELGPQGGSGSPVAHVVLCVFDFAAL